MKTIFISIVFLLVLSNNAWNQNAETKFLFPDDNEVKEENISDNYTKNTNLLNDEFFSSPPSRLDLTLLYLNLYQKEVINDSIFSFHMFKNFEQLDKTYVLNDISYSINYSAQDDLIDIYIIFKNLGKPKLPMKNTCDEILDILNLKYNERFIYHITRVLLPYLGDKKFDAISKILSDSIIINVALISSYNDITNNNKVSNYEFVCRKKLNDVNIYYSKQKN